MAERRMFSSAVVRSDNFLDMPSSAQLLYFHLGMVADDDGFINSPKRVMREVNASQGDMKTLIEHGFIIIFETGIAVVRHWKQNNHIQKDRYKRTQFANEREMLHLNGETYVLNTECNQDVSNVDTKCIQSVSKVDTQYSIGKGSQVELREVEGSTTTVDDFFEVRNPVEDAIRCNRIEMSARAWAELQGFMEDGIDPDMLKLAISDMLDHGVRNWAYLKKILNSWIMKGYKSAADVVRQQDKGKDNGSSESWYQVGFTQ